ncbi:MAG: hydrolase [Anaerolineae bacterium]|jgi:N-carbamoylputrescine amidase|nr:hydrolase [Anaerolineae bacterium]
MQEQFTLALVQLAWAGSAAAMQQAYVPLIAQAAARAQVVCLPELSLAPYFPATTDPAGFAWAEPLTGPANQFFAAQAQQHRITLVGSFFERTPEDDYYNVAVIYGPDGQRLGYTRKIHIPSGAGYHETHFFRGGSDYPVWDTGLCHLATPTCYDQWFPELARIYALKGAEVLFYPTAIGAEPTDPDMDSMPAWQTVMRGHAIASGVYVAAANRTGRENGSAFYGSSFICDPMGTVLAQAGRDTTEVIFADVRADVLARWRGLFPLLHQRRPHTYGALTQPADTPPPGRWQQEKLF